jgi:hypothetical protein
MSEVQAVEIPFKKGDIIKYNATGHVANVMNVINTPGRQAIIVDNDDKGNSGMTRLEVDPAQIAATGWFITRIR